MRLQVLRGLLEPAEVVLRELLQFVRCDAAIPFRTRTAWRRARLFLLELSFAGLFASRFSSFSAEAPISVHLRGDDTADYSLTYEDGADFIHLHWIVDLHFVPQNLSASGQVRVSHSATFDGSFHTIGTAEEVSKDDLSHNSISFDHVQEVSAPTPYPVETTFDLDGDLKTLDLSLTSPTTPYVYRLHFQPGKAASTIWTRLPQPFVYSQDNEANPITLTTDDGNTGASFTGHVKDDSTGDAIVGAAVQIGGFPATTDQTGTFVVDHVPPGSLTVQITKAGYQAYEHTAIMPDSPVTREFRLHPLCFEWKNPGIDGSYFVSQNWDGGSVPAATNQICLTDGAGSAEITTIEIPYLAGQTYKVGSINVNSGRWNLDLFAPTFDVAPVNGSVQVAAGAELIVSAGGVLTTPSLQLAPGSSLGRKGGTIEVSGDLIMTEAGDLTVELFPDTNVPDVPLIRVKKTFAAGGKLTIKAAPNYVPKAGDRFRLVEFGPDTKAVEDIYTKYLFKNYDAVINNELFWGLTFRDGGDGKKFIEILVLKVPKLWGESGGLLEPESGKNGLILITHGTSDKIESAADGLGELAAAMAQFQATEGNPDWQVATFDWHEYATRPLGQLGPDSDFNYNPATSAQIGIGIAESLVHWMKISKVSFPYLKYHLLGHSSGSWLVNRMMQLIGDGLRLQLTFFDAFTNPVKQDIFHGCELNLYCDRFASELGTSTEENVFTEHIVDRNTASPPGTNERLQQAVNFDVSTATISSPPGHSPDIVLPGRPDLLGVIVYFADLAKAAGEAHAWPIKWYLESVRIALRGEPFVDEAHCGGFVLSPEFLESEKVPSEVRSRLIADRFQMHNYDEFKIAPHQCTDTTPAPSAIFQFFSKFFQQPETIGTHHSTDGSDFEMSIAETAPAQSLTALSTGGQFAAVTSKVAADKPLIALRFSYAFGGQTNGLLSVYLDDRPVQGIAEPFAETTELGTSDVLLAPIAASGSHTISFRLDTLDGHAASVLIKDVELGFDERPKLSISFPGALAPLGIQFQAVTTKTNYVVETSTNLIDWPTLTNVFTTDSVIRVNDGSATNKGNRFYRLVVP
jgi:hypothetical protein